MDGFAVRADEAQPGARLPVVARIAAGAPADRDLAPGEAMAISTGGAVPEGADTVIPLELVEDSGDAIEIREVVAQGGNVRERGSDVRGRPSRAGASARARPVGALTRRDPQCSARSGHAWESS
jgi:molybdopterin biosynthesis enzyme